MDDEPTLARMMGKMLESLGCRAQVVTTSAEALSTFRNAPGAVGLVLTDQTMPGMTGDLHLLARKLLEVRHDLPIVICTGYSATMDEGKALALGAKGLPRKPLGRAVLAKKLREVSDDLRDTTVPPV